MRAIIRWTLWQRRWSTMWWSAGISAFILLNMVFYPSFKNQAADLQKSFESLPDAAVQLFGGSTDFFSPVGFLNSQIFFLMLPLLLGVLAIALGSSLLAREEHDKTIETLLSRPLSRSKLLASKALAGVAILGSATAAGLATTLMTAQLVDLDVAASRIIAATALCFVLALSFGAIAFALAATGKARTASLGIASAVALGGYLISSLAGTVSWLETPAKLFPFHYYRPEAILIGSFDWLNLVFLSGIIALFGIISWAPFRRRDIY